MSIFKPKSIVHRFNVTILSIVSVSLIGFATTIAYTNYYRTIDDLRVKAENILDLAKISLEEPIWNLHTEALNKIRDSILRDPDVIALKITDELGVTLSERKLEMLKDVEFSALEQNLEFQYQRIRIVKEDSVIGEIHIVLSNEKALNLVISTTVQIMTFSLLLILLLGIIVTLTGIKLLKRPIDELENNAIELGKGNLEHDIDTSRDDELGVLAKGFVQMRNSIRENIQIIEKQNHTLEQKVLERTSEIQDLLDNTGQGFLTFSSNYIIDPQYSKASETFFGQPIHGLSSLDLLYDGTQSKTTSEVDELFGLIFNGMSFDMLGGLLPQEITVHDSILTLDYQLITPSGGQQAQKIMVVLTNVTREKALSKQIKADEERNLMIVKVALDKDGFIQFLNEIKQLFQSIRSNLQPSSDEIDLNVLFRNYHTIKGGTASYGMKTVAAQAHQIESSLADIRQHQKTLTSTNVEQLEQETNDLENTLHKTLEELEQILPPEERDTEETFLRVANSKISRLEHFMFETFGRESVKKIREAVDLLYEQSISSTLKKYANIAQELGGRMNKQVEVELKGLEVEVSSQRLGELFNVLIHLIRNCVDHGLEEPDIRLMLGKTREGHLRIEAEKDDTRFQLRISDDGPGLDTERLLSIAVKKNIVTEEEAQQLSKQEIFGLIFKAGFSTKETVSDISGRGVGMDAVNTVVQELGGTIQIQSELGQGTTFEIKIPHHV